MNLKNSILSCAFAKLLLLFAFKKTENKTGLIECPVCKTTISAEAKMCYSCGTKFIEVEVGEGEEAPPKPSPLPPLVEDKILKECEQKLLQNPLDADAWRLRGERLLELQRYDDAQQAFEKTIELKPADRYAWLAKAYLLTATGRGRESVAAYRKAMELVIAQSDLSIDTYLRIVGEAKADTESLDKLLGELVGKPGIAPPTPPLPPPPPPPPPPSAQPQPPLEAEAERLYAVAPIFYPPSPPKAQVIPRETKWRFMVLGLVVTLFLVAPLIGVLFLRGEAQEIIKVDGSFTDWTDIYKFSHQTGITNPYIDIEKSALYSDKNSLAFYLKTKEAILKGSAEDGRVDTVYIFIDTDWNFETGYKIHSIGADYTVQIYGCVNKVAKSSLYKYDAEGTLAGWFWNWKYVCAVKSAAKNCELEAKLFYGDIGDTKKMDVYFSVQSYDGAIDFSDFIHTKEKALLKVFQTNPANGIANNTVAETILRLELTAVGDDLKISEMILKKIGSASLQRLTAIADGKTIAEAPLQDDHFTLSLNLGIQNGEKIILSLNADLSAANPHDTIGIKIAQPHDIVITKGTVALLNLQADNYINYIVSPPTNVEIDGAFADWFGIEKTDAVNDVPNPGLDIVRYGTALGATKASFYVRVDGEFAAGTKIPFKNTVTLKPVAEKDSDRDTIPDSIDPYPYDFNNDGIDDRYTDNDVDGDGIADYPYGDDYWLETTISESLNVPPEYKGKTVRIYKGPSKLPPIVGEDRVAVFLDTDDDKTTGYPISDLGADYILLVSGKCDQLLLKKYYEYGEKGWRELGDIPAEADSKQVELSIGLEKINLIDELKIFILTSNWDNTTQDDISTSTSSTTDSPVPVTLSCSKTTAEGCTSNYTAQDNRYYLPELEKEETTVRGGSGSGWIEDKGVGTAITSERRPAMATDSNGYIYCAYERWYDLGGGHWGIRIDYSTNGGATWTLFNSWYYTNANVSYLDIAISPFNNTIFVVFDAKLDIYTDRDIFCAIGWNGGASWVYDKAIDFDANDDRFPAITSDYAYGSANRQYVSYEYLYTYDDRDLMFAYSTNHGNSWTVTKLHGDSPEANYDYVYTQTSISTAYGTATGSYVYIAYRFAQDYNTNGDIYVDYSHTSGSSWTRILIEGGANDCSYPSVKATHGGNAVVVAFQYAYSPTDMDVRCSYSINNGVSWTQDVWLAATSQFERFPRLTVDGEGYSSAVAGRVHCAYVYNVTGLNMFYMHYKCANVTALDAWNPAGANPIDNGNGLVQTGYRYSDLTTQLRPDGNWYPAVAWTDFRSLNYDIYYTTPGATYIITTDPTGLEVIVDGSAYSPTSSSYPSFNWVAGYSHTISVNSPQGTYTFSHWSDGGAQTHTIVIATADTTITAYFVPSHEKTTLITLTIILVALPFLMMRKKSKENKKKY